MSNILFLIRYWQTVLRFNPELKEDSFLIHIEQTIKHLEELKSIKETNP